MEKISNAQSGNAAIFEPSVLRYTAPELLLEENESTEKSDIYSLAMTTYEVGLSRTIRGLC